MHPAGGLPDRAGFLCEVVSTGGHLPGVFCVGEVILGDGKYIILIPHPAAHRDDMLAALAAQPHQQFHIRVHAGFQATEKLHHCVAHNQGRIGLLAGHGTGCSFGDFSCDLMEGAKTGGLPFCQCLQEWRGDGGRGQDVVARGVEKQLVDIAAGGALHPSNHQGAALNRGLSEGRDRRDRFRFSRVKALFSEVAHRSDIQ